MKKIRDRLIGLLIVLSLLTTPVLAASELVPVGTVVGLELQNDAVTIAAFDGTSQAKNAGMAVGDRLMAMDGHPITCAEDVQHALMTSDGTVEITLQREGKLLQMRVSPEITRDGPKLGVYLKQGITGIGTVTYYDPETGVFGTLGHGVNDSSGKLLTLTGGCAYEARVPSVRKGKIGDPGQLVGALTDQNPLGSLYRNTAQGVFGKTDHAFGGQPLPVASAEDVKPGSAVILSTVTGNSPREYSVEIVKVYSTNRTNGRNMLIRITDPTLLETTGGIVQGMSGSPIIQDGKLVGAVTHVLVNDPTTGYGIFIENMLDAAA